MSPSSSRKVTQAQRVHLSRQAHRLTLLWHQAQAAEQAYLQALADLAPPDPASPTPWPGPGPTPSPTPSPSPSDQPTPLPNHLPNHLIDNILDATSLDTIYDLRPVHRPGVPVPSIDVQRNPILATSARFPLTSLDHLIRLTRAIYARLDHDQEHFAILACDVRTQAYAYKVIAAGALAHVDVDPALLFRHALLLGAHSIVLMHNHPSGDPDPSPEDVTLTMRMVTCGAIVNCQVLDHIIIGQHGPHLSLRSHRPSLWPHG